MPTKVSAAKPKERVYVQLRKIRENKNLDKFEKAKAILAIPKEDIVWSDNPYELAFAKRDALNVINGNDKSLRDDLKNAFSYLKQKGITAFTAISNYFSSSNSIAQNTK